MPISRDDFPELLEKCFQLCHKVPASVVPVSDDGSTILEAATPGCLLFVQCGEYTLVRLDEQMRIRDVEFF